MKKILFALFVTILSISAAAAKGPVITFADTDFDFGNIHASRGVVKATYTVTNTGTEPLVIVSVSNGGCGCTKPDFPKQPIAPGKSGTITIKFDPSGRRGELRREVKVKSNASNGKRKSLTFKGVILP